jgi:hypothetical protein
MHNTASATIDNLNNTQWIIDDSFTNFAKLMYHISPPSLPQNSHLVQNIFGHSHITTCALGDKLEMPRVRLYSQP